MRGRAKVQIVFKCVHDTGEHYHTKTGQKFEAADKPIGVVLRRCSEHPATEKVEIPKAPEKK